MNQQCTTKQSSLQLWWWSFFATRSHIKASSDGFLITGSLAVSPRWLGGFIIAFSALGRTHITKTTNLFLTILTVTRGKIGWQKGQDHEMPSAIIMVLHMGASILMLLTPLTYSFSFWVIFSSNSVVLPLLPSSRAEDTESLQMAQSCCYSSVSLAFLTSSVGREGSNSQHCFLCQLWLVGIKST